jgi:hypothetical protein
MWLWPLEGDHLDMTYPMTLVDVDPEVPSARLADAISCLRGSCDPLVTFAGLAGACVPQFADGCQFVLGDAAGRQFRMRHPAGPPASSGQILLTPFQVAPKGGWPSCAGLFTHWWNGEAPDDRVAVIAELMVKHATALVEQERMRAVSGQAYDRVVSLSLQAIRRYAL